MQNVISLNYKTNECVFRFGQFAFYGFTVESHLRTILTSVVTSGYVEVMLKLC